jgi:hypothetical protein
MSIRYGVYTQMSCQKNEAPTQPLRWVPWLAVSLPFIVAGGAIWKYARHFGTELASKQETWGQFGDYLGGVVNPVVGLVSIGFLLFTLRSQQTELREQREQIAKQGFEQTLNTWLNSYRDAVHQVYFDRATLSEPVRFSGIRAIHEMLLVEMEDKETPSEFLVKKAAQHLQSIRKLSESPEFHTRQKNAPPHLRKDVISELLRRRPLTRSGWHWWRRVYADNEMYFGMLLRTLYTLIRWIDDHKAITWEQKWDYVSIVRARLSTPELVMLFFNHTDARGKRFTAYVERYALLDNLPEQSHYFVDIARAAGAHRFDEASFSSDIARRNLLSASRPTSISEQRRRDEKLET